MNNEHAIEIKIKTLTPLWTGGVGGKCDRLHETGIIGSMRWWYEAIIRGLDGYACDPTSGNHCELSGKEKTDEERSKKLCPACWLFGCGGWKRRFRLEVIKEPELTPLHFRSGLSPNRKWLAEIFGDNNKSIQNIGVPFGDFTLRIVPLGHDKGDNDLALKKLALILKLIEQYGGLGAKLQHGFGIIQVTKWPGGIDASKILDIIPTLNQEIDQWPKGSQKNTIDPQWNFQNFISLSFDLPKEKLNEFLKNGAHVGAKQKENELRYIPCTFDIRYKGKEGKFGMREWLRKKKGWKETTNPRAWEELDRLLGPRSNWKDRAKNKISIDNDWRRAGSLYFSMPYGTASDAQKYRIRIYGFVPPDLNKVGRQNFDSSALSDLAIEYMKHAFGDKVEPSPTHFGSKILSVKAGEIGGRS